MINSKKKGTAYELAVIKELRSIYGDNVHSSRLMSRDMDNQLVDIVGDVPFNIQCKRTENLPQVHKIFDSINREKPPVIFWKKNHKPQIVIMEAETFLELILDKVCEK